jgi:hypothetical protein
VASCFTAAVGCSIEEPDKLTQQLSATLGPVRQLPCPELLLVAEPLDPATDFDYIGVFDARGGSKYRALISDYGDPCRTAKDRDACVTALQEAVDRPAVCEPVAAHCRPIIVTTLGDAVTRHETIESLRRLLGDANTASEAVLFAQLYGLHAACAAGSLEPAASGTLVQSTAAGWRVQSRWSDPCNEGIGDQAIEIRHDGSSDGLVRDIVNNGGCAVGRRPAGLQLTAAAGVREPIAAFLAQHAQLEAASVPAFVRLARDLHRLGAPRLAAAARRSARDEVRHTALLTRLAARYGARPTKPRVATERRSRTAYELAHENAVEGCVRETFGALQAWQQSVLAADPLIAGSMRRIAADETRHAELSWHVAAWLEPQLTASERKQLARARFQALEALARELAENTLPTAAQVQLGWPSPSRQSALLQRFAADMKVC